MSKSNATALVGGVSKRDIRFIKGALCAVATCGFTGSRSRHLRMRRRKRKTEEFLPLLIKTLS